MRARSIAIPVALAALALGACATEPPQVDEPEPDSVSGRGLRRAEGDGEAVVYAMPGARLDRYSEVMVDPFMISYTTEPRPAGAEAEPIRTLDRETEAKLSDAMREAFVRSLRHSRHFSVVDEPGPRTLHVQGWIYDLVVGDPEVHRRELPICFAQMTLILTARDARTAQALALVAHRLATRCEPRRFLDALRWDDVTRALEPWARILRDHLDGLHDVHTTSEGASDG